MKVYYAVLIALVACAQAHVSSPQVSAYYRAYPPFVLARSYAPPAPAPALYSYYSAPASTSHAYTVSHYQPAPWTQRLYPQAFSSIPLPYLNSFQSYQPVSFVHQIPQTVTTTLIDQQQYLPSPSNDLSSDDANDDTINVEAEAQVPDEANSDDSAVEVGQGEQGQTLPPQQIITQQFPAQQFPSQQFPSQQFPAQQFPALQFPAQQFPAQQFPAQQFPAQQFPALQFPAQQFPAQQFPAQQFPAQQFPAQQFPAQQFPAQQFPAQQFPTPQFPSQEEPAHQFPQQEISPTQQPEQTNTEAIFGESNHSGEDSNNDDTITVESA